MEDVIIIEEYARQSHTDIQFIHQLSEFGLIQVVIEQQMQYLPSHQLPLLEKYTRLHYDLDINMEGIEAISHLLQRIEYMQMELKSMQTKMRLYNAF